MEARAPGVSDGQAVAIRTKFYDDTLEWILAHPAIDQLVSSQPDWTPEHFDYRCRTVLSPARPACSGAEFPWCDPRVINGMRVLGENR